MATLNIRNVPDDVVAALKTRAKRNGNSLNSEIVGVLTESAERRSVDEILASIDRRRDGVEKRPSGGEVTAWVRDARDERGPELLRNAGRRRKP